MKHLNLKVIVASLALSAAALLPSNLAAQAASPYATIAGSSAMFNAMGFAAFELNGGGYYLCGQHHWSYKSSGAIGGGNFVAIHDSRSASILDEAGTIWVSWNDAEVASPYVGGGKVCAYLQVDSTVGVRAALARTAAGTPAASVLLDAALVGKAGQGKVPNTTIADEALPAAVYSTLNNALITIAAADIRAEDAKFATSRVLATQGAGIPNSFLTTVKGLGYANTGVTILGGHPLGYSIQSSQSTSTANPVDFALFGTDPVSGGAAAPYFHTYNVGAGPVMVFVNTQNAVAGHLGDPNLQNINGNTLAGFLDGSFSRTRDLLPIPAGGAYGDFPVKTFIREPLSGTMNTIEYNVPNTFRYFTSQENGVTGSAPAAGNTSNPLALPGASVGSGRYRCIGTGEEVATTIKATNTDSIGYSFWGYGNFSAVTSGAIARYLTVDGIDPLYSNPSANPNGLGVFPQKTGGVYPVLSFPNIVNGSYPIWTVYRLVAVPEADSSVVSNFVSIAQGDAATFSDFIPATNLQVFQSHFYTSNIGGSNGHVYDAADGIYYPEQGGSVGGQVFQIQADYDFIADTAAAGSLSELVNRHK